MTLKAKKLIFVLAICWLASSCSVGYGCPYSVSDNEMQAPTPQKTFVKDAEIPGECLASSNECD